MASRWDHILDLKPRSLEAHLLDEVAKRLTAELADFPPPIEGFESAPDAARFAPLFEAPHVRPDPGVYRVAFHLARLELEREVEAIDDYMRNERYRPLAPTPRDRLAFLFLSRWLTEQLLDLREALRSKLPRAKLVACLDEVERRLLSASKQA